MMTAKNSTKITAFKNGEALGDCSTERNYRSKQVA